MNFTRIHKEMRHFLPPHSIFFVNPPRFPPMFFFPPCSHVMSGREMRADMAAFKAENRGDVSLEVFLQWRTELENLSGWADMSDAVEG